MLLNLPAEIKNRIYEEVFKGSEICLRVVGHRDGRALVQCTCPEDTRILRTCRQTEEDATLALASVTTFLVSPGEQSAGFPTYILRGANSPKAPRLLRQTIPFFRVLELQSNYLRTLNHDLLPYIRLRELQLRTPGHMKYSLAKSFVKNPLLLLGSANDSFFVINALAHIRNSARGTYGALTNWVRKGHMQDAATSSTYKVLWEGIVSMRRPPSEWEPLAEYAASLAPVLEMVRTVQRLKGATGTVLTLKLGICGRPQNKGYRFEEVPTSQPCKMGLRPWGLEQTRR